jgi:tape measure domain-containing protein
MTQERYARQIDASAAALARAQLRYDREVTEAAARNAAARTRFAAAEKSARGVEARETARMASFMPGTVAWNREFAISSERVARAWERVGAAHDRMEETQRRGARRVVEAGRSVGLARTGHESTAAAAAEGIAAAEALEAGLNPPFTRIAMIAAATATAIIAVTKAVVSLAREAIVTSAEIEMMEVGIKAIGGSAEETTKLLGDLRDLALKTPFTTPDLLEATQELLAFGRATEEIIPDLKMVGELAGGNTQRFKEVAYIYGKIVEQGRLYQRDINQLAGRGIPVYQELAATLGLVERGTKKLDVATMTQLRNMVHQGLITSDVMQQVFQNMTMPGGLLHGRTEAAMGTLRGAFSNVREQIIQTLRNIGDELEKGLDLKPVMATVSESFAQFNNWLKGISAETMNTVRTVVALSAAFIGLVAALTAVTYAWQFLSITVLVVSGSIVALIAVATMLVESVGGLRAAATIVYNFGIAIGYAVEKYRLVEQLSAAFQQLVTNVWQFIQVNQELFITLAVIGSAILTAVAAWKLLTLTIWLAVAAYNFLAATWVGRIILWIAHTAAIAAWTAVLLVAKGVVIIFNAVVAFLNLLMSGQLLILILDTAAWLVYGAATLVAKVAIWLLNAALAVLNVLLSPIAIIAAAVAFTVLTTAAVGLYATILGVVASVGGLITTLTNLGRTSGFFKELSDGFSRISGELRYTFELLKQDGRLAWEVFEAQARVAFEYVKEVLSRLIGPFKIVIDEIGTYMQKVFSAKFKDVTDSFAIGFELGLLKSTNVGGVNDAAIRRLQGELKKLEADTADTIKQAGLDLANNITTAFSDPILKGVLSGKFMSLDQLIATQRLANIKEVAEATLAMRKGWDKLKNAIPDESTEIGKQSGENFAGAFFHEFSRIQAIRFGSAEHLSTLQAYLRGAPGIDVYHPKKLEEAPMPHEVYKPLPFNPGGFPIPPEFQRFQNKTGLAEPNVIDMIGGQKEIQSSMLTVLQTIEQNTRPEIKPKIEPARVGA